MLKDVNDIIDRNNDFSEIADLIKRMEIGLRAIAVMYDDHSSDKRSKEKIFNLKDNTFYRLLCIGHQYQFLLNGLQKTEIELDKKQRNQSTILELSDHNMTMIEVEISSLFDSFIFHLTSLFDYLSHMVFYVINKNKDQTHYWLKLAKSARDSKNDIYNLSICETIRYVDANFVSKLYDYRSVLIHNRRDNHTFYATYKLANNSYKIKVLASNILLKFFNPQDKFDEDKSLTLAYVSSELIRRSMNYIEILLDAMAEEILNESHFEENVFNPKDPNALNGISMDPITKTVRPISEGLWNQFKGHK